MRDYPAYSAVLGLSAVFILLLGGSAVSVAAATLSTGDTVYTGRMSGDGKVESFLGIPFAQAPVGDLRWRAPRPVVPEKRVAAAEFGPACAQSSHIVDWYRNVAQSFGADPEVVQAPRFSEDCLYLNIWRPVGSADAGLPVFVYIHGGSNKGGWSYEPNYIGEHLARRGMVVVSVAYRLGVFGFFSHPELKQANFGLLDQVAALQWIRAHIGDVGGDPDNVTVAGESAGANNISHLLASPLAQGLFRRAVHQSGGWAVLGRTTARAHRARGVELQARLLGDQGSIGQMRRLSTQQVLESAAEVYAGHGFDPVIDGHSLRSSVRQVLAEQKFPLVDLLIGSNADEWLMYLDPAQTVDGWIAETLPQNKADLLKATLRDMKSTEHTLDVLITAYNFVCPSMYLAERVRERGGRSWFYYFARQREGAQAATMGAYHGAELPYVFGTHDDWLPTSDVDYRLTEAIMSYWANFARSGDPNGDGLELWPAFTRETAMVQRLDADISSQVHTSLALCNILLPFG